MEHASEAELRSEAQTANLLLVFALGLVVLAAIAFLTGMARQELSEPELDVNDRRFPVIIAVRAVKREGGTP